MSVPPKKIPSLNPIQHVANLYRDFTQPPLNSFHSAQNTTDTPYPDTQETFHDTHSTSNHLSIPSAPPLPTTLISPPAHCTRYRTKNMPSEPIQSGAQSISNNMNTLNISETIPANRFNGESGLGVHAFIQEVEGRVSSMDIPDDQFDGACLKVARARMDLSATILPALMASFNGAPDSQRTWKILKQDLILEFSKSETQADLLLVEITLQRPPSFSESDIRLFIYKLKDQINKWARATDSDFTYMQTRCVSEQTYAQTTKSLIMLVLNGSLPTLELRRKVAPKLRLNTIDKFPNIIATAMTESRPQHHIVAAATKTQIPPQNPQSTQQQNTSSSLVRPYTHQTNRQPNTRNSNTRQNSFKQQNNRQNNRSYSGQTPNKQFSRQQFQDFLHKSNNQTQHAPHSSNNVGNNSANPNFFPHRGQCFKCLNDGHTARFCEGTAFCPYHALNGHCFVDCKEFAHLAMKLLQRMGPKAQSALSYLQTNNTNVAFFGIGAIISAEELQDSAHVE